MSTHYYAVFVDEQERVVVAMYVGKHRPLSIDDVAGNPLLMGLAVWYGRVPKIASEYELERYEDDPDWKVIYLYPENNI